MAKKVTKSPAVKTEKKVVKKTTKTVKKAKPAVTKTKKQNQADLMQVFSDNRIGIFLQASGITAIMAILFAAAGYYLDMHFGTKPTFLTIGLVIGYPSTLLLLLMKFKRFAKAKLNEAVKK